MRLDQCCGFDRIAVDRSLPGVAQLLDHLPVLLGDHERNASIVERPRNVPTYPAVSNQNNLAGEVFLLGGRRQFREWIVRTLEPTRELRPASQPTERWIEHGEHEGVQGDRDQGAGQDEALSLRGQQTQRHADPGQDERKLANLGEARRHREGSAERVSQEEHERRDDDEHLQRLVQYNGRVEEHADRDEKQYGERVHAGALRRDELTVRDYAIGRLQHTTEASVTRKVRGTRAVSHTQPLGSRRPIASRLAARSASLANALSMSSANARPPPSSSRKLGNQAAPAAS